MVLAAIVAIVVVASLAVSIFAIRQSHKEQDVIKEVRNSTLRQNQQHLQEEANATQPPSANAQLAL